MIQKPRPGARSRTCLLLLSTLLCLLVALLPARAERPVVEPAASCRPGCWRVEVEPSSQIEARALSRDPGEPGLWGALLHINRLGVALYFMPLSAEWQSRPPLPGFTAWMGTEQARSDHVYLVEGGARMTWRWVRLHYLPLVGR